jgi:hypothetical protein
VSGATLAVVLLLAAALVSCAGAGGSDATSSEAVARVGAVVIDRATLDHWARAISLGSVVAGVPAGSSLTSRQKALEFLISANWAIGAAAEHGLVVSEGAVARGLQEKIDAVPHGRSQFGEEIAATGQTPADVKLEVKAGLASQALRAFVSEHVAPVTQTQIARYYRKHLQSFRIPDKRVTDLIEEIRHYPRAVALGRRLGPGARFAKKAMHELVPRETAFEYAHAWNGKMVRAIFATSPGRVGGPVSFHEKWVLFVVRKLVPGHIKPLGEVRAEIAQRLSEERRSQALARFFQAYRREWRAKTSCSAGFLVQKCSEYRERRLAQVDAARGD